MATDRNKIARTLSAEELQRFCERLGKERGVTLQTIADFFEEETGEKVSLMGASSFRDTTFRAHLQRLEKANALSKLVREQREAGAGNTLADAAAAILTDEVLDKLTNRDFIDMPLDLDVLSKIVARLRLGDVRVAALEHKIATDRDDAVKRVLANPKLAQEVAKIAADKGLSASEKSARIQLRLFGERPRDFRPHTASADAEDSRRGRGDTETRG